MKWQNNSITRRWDWIGLLFFYCESLEVYRWKLLISTITESSQNTFSIGNVLKSLQSLTNSVIDEFVRFSLRLHLSCWGAPGTIAFMKVFTIRLLHFAHKKCCFVNKLREYMRNKVHVIYFNADICLTCCATVVYTIPLRVTVESFRF